MQVMVVMRDANWGCGHAGAVCVRLWASAALKLLTLPCACLFLLFQFTLPEFDLLPHAVFLVVNTSKDEDIEEE